MNRRGYIKRHSAEFKFISFELVYKMHFDSLYTYGIKITKDRELVEDCIQELFYRILKNKIDLNSVSYVKSYLFKGLRRQILNSLELKYYKINKVEVEEELHIDFSPEDYLIHNQSEEILRRKVLKVLNSLSPKQREAIYLRYFEDLEYQDIAIIMNIKLQSVKNNVQRGLFSMRGSLSFLSGANFQFFLF